MRRTLLFFVLLMGFPVFPVAVAQVLTLADVKVKNGVQLSASEVKQLLPGAKVVSLTNAGSTRSWHNAPDGAFAASSDSRGADGRGRPASGTGTWRLTDDGRYCVAIQWNRQTEDWCRYIFKAGDKYYGVGKLEDTAVASEFAFSK
jgi:hypothetical protein